MSRTRQDLGYYEQLAVQIVPRHPTRDLPTGIELRLRNSLPNFGIVWDFQILCVRQGTIVKGRPNLAIVVFSSQLAVTKILDSSERDKPGSLWQTNSIMAHTLEQTGPVAEYFSTQIVPRLSSLPRANGQPSSSQVPPRFTPSQPASSTPKDFVPPTIQCPRAEGWERALDGITTGGHTVPFKSSQSTGLTLGSPEWMRARISQLEAELDTARAVRDMALSEQSVVRLAHQTEQNARREATAQKSAAEAELSRKGVEQGQLRVELNGVLTRESVLLKDNHTLRKLLAFAEGELKLVRSSLDDSEKCMQRVKTLESQLEEVQNRAHKLQLQNARLEQQQKHANTTELDVKEKLKKSDSEVKHLRADLASTQEQLEAARASLESTEQKCSSARRMYENTKEKLGTYKERLESEETIVHKLKGTLTPEVYRSLGATYEALGGFLSVVGLPPLCEGGVAPKKESD
ncbi:unnamed protein product [Rhizoctonia solani]|uniref:Uncharacterized protein n=1 Tax=Rhizoctonia solani TaxID=456999 RepID=A0A8H3BJS1_9AGAM|nr:unnamed protein product [Rhizoctonia solani]CAE6502365.1 unnamed protein product [Rhizoctonia solani]